MPKTKAPAPKGFASKPQAGTSTKKKDENDTEEKVAGEIGKTEVDLESSISSNAVKRGVDVLEKVVEDDDTNNSLDDDSASQPAEYEDLNGGKGSKVKGVMAYVDGNSATLETESRLEVIVGQEHTIEHDEGTSLKGSSVKPDRTEYIENQIDKMELTRNNSLQAESKEEKEAVADIDVDISETKGILVKQEERMDAQAQRKLLENLAEKNLASGKKVFVYPEVVKSDADIEVFIDRNSSALANENEIFIKGAFNGWRWKSFTEEMQKTDLKGDWWSCHLYVPREAYRIDFVFFNGGTLYENNNYGDYFVPVEGGLGESGFEDYLLQEKRKELQKLAAEQAERERQAEEQRRREAEKAASEADLAQAKMEVQKKREAIHQVMKLATKSVDGLWDVEPSIFKGENRVRLYYNRTARPLEHASEIWIHGGHNNWSDGLTIVEKLQRSERKDGDWWYTEGTYEKLLCFMY